MVVWWCGVGSEAVADYHPIWVRGSVGRKHRPVDSEGGGWCNTRHKIRYTKVKLKCSNIVLVC